MKINDTMNLDELAERMGADATAYEAAHMRAALVDQGRYSRTEDVPESEWMALCDAAIARAKGGAQ